MKLVIANLSLQTSLLVLHDFFYDFPDSRMYARNQIQIAIKEIL